IDISQQGHEGLPASNATAAARLKASPRHSEWVKIAWEPGSKDSLMAWVVYPKSSGKAPVVVVVHEIFGLSTWVQSVADQVAAEGFIAIAPDLLSRVRGGPSTVTLTNDSAQKIVGGVNTTERNKGIIAVANYGMMLASAQPKYGVIGYCWGGQTVWAHAVNGGVKGYSGGVAFYGAFPYNDPGTPATATTSAVPGTPNTDSLKKISKPLMLLSGTGDARIGASMPYLDSALKSMKKDYFGMNYPGAIHGFLRAQDDSIPPRAGRAGQPAPTPRPDAELQAEQAANLAATKDGWPRTVAFLKKNLK
ncbi:MAG: dienelactone hydrolase family protein, partial [Gemmatimonadota bacterium]|nr:dienelactone hydrolase family protein [Gemmatimonadota bacterium]